MSEAPRVLLVGATGLIGRTIIARSPALTGVILQGVARREIPFGEGVRMELVLAESDACARALTESVSAASSGPIRGCWARAA